MNEAEGSLLEHPCVPNGLDLSLGTCAPRGQSLSPLFTTSLLTVTHSQVPRCRLSPDLRDIAPTQMLTFL